MTVGVAMNTTKEALFWELSAKRSADEVYESVAAYAARLGFSFCCYGMRLPVPVSNRPVHIFDNYPDGWMPHYLDKGYIKTDPVVRLGAQTSAQMVWCREAFATAGSLWADAQDWGLGSGVSQSVWTPPGTFGVLSLARSEEAVSTTEAAWLSEPLLWLANVSHQCISRFYSSDVQTDEERASLLTPRELEVLCWTGEGKTAYEIGMILNISARTVNFHICNVISKLCVSNKIQAAVKALALGLI
jgi:LuxR family quorum-sensing system transcriptional regulator SolR